MSQSSCPLYFGTFYLHIALLPDDKDNVMNVFLTVQRKPEVEAVSPGRYRVFIQKQKLAKNLKEEFEKKGCNVQNIGTPYEIRSIT